MTLGPCTPWVSASEVLAAIACDPPESAEDATLAALVEEANETAYALLGRRFPGPCEAVVRPVLRGECWDGRRSAQIPLNMPVVAVTEVKVDGAVVTDWHLRDGYLLCRNTGYWPTSQKVYLPDTDDDTFSVAYSFGPTPPALAVRCALEIAVKGWEGRLADPAYALGPGVTSASSQGLTVQIDPEKAASYPVTLQAVATFNPDGSWVPADVYPGDPDWDLLVVSLPA